MSSQLDLMFDLLQQEVEQLTAELERLDNQNLDTTTSKTNSPLDVTLEFEFGKSLKKENSSNSITSNDNNNYNDYNINPSHHQRSVSNFEIRNLHTTADTTSTSTSFHQKSKSADSHNTKLNSSLDSNYLSPTQLLIENSLNYQRISSLSNLSSNSDATIKAVPMLSPILSHKTITKSDSSYFSDSDGDGDGDGDVNAYSTDTNNSSDDDGSNLLKKNDSSPSNIDNDKSPFPDSTISSISSYSSVSSGGSRLSNDSTIGRGLGKPPIINLKDIDDENSPLYNINLTKSQELNDIIATYNHNVNNSKNDDTDDDEKLPLKSIIKDINLDNNQKDDENQSHANSKVQDSNIVAHSSEKAFDDFKSSNNNNNNNEIERSSDEIPIQINKRSESHDISSDDNKYNVEGERQVRSRDNSERMSYEKKLRRLNSRNKRLERMMISHKNLEQERESNKNIEDDNDRDRARSTVHGEKDRIKTKSRVQDEEEHERVKSKEEERGEVKSKVHREEEREGAKSNPKEHEFKENAKSSTENDDTKSRTREHDLSDKEKLLHEKNKRQWSKISKNRLTTQIFIEETGQYRTLSITSTRTALDILNYLRLTDAIPDSDIWALFEVINEYAIERPIRDWEYVATVIGTWEANKQNALVLKKYPNRGCLTLEGFKNAVPPMFGSLQLEIKKNKWQKRHFMIRYGAVYHYKDAKGNNETFLCSLSNFDVYTFTKAVRKSPTKFIFALKSQEKLAMYENPNEYIYYLCADHYEKMKDWVLSFRAAKNNLLRAEQPERFIERPIESRIINIIYPEKSEDFIESNEFDNKISDRRKYSNQWDNLRKFVHTSKTYSKASDRTKYNSLKKKRSLNNIIIMNKDQPFKEGSLLNFNEKLSSPTKQEVSGSPFAKGSLLASNYLLFE